MNLSRFPRRQYTPGPTPLEPLPRFSQALGGPNVFIKRDDLLGLTGGGNKARKLEFLVADALAQGADTLITCGAMQSNHCRLTLAAAVREGLRCRLILSEPDPGAYRPDASGNILLFHLLGAERIKVVPDGADWPTELCGAAEEAKAEGLKPYIIPLGGSNALGALGYVACAEEIMAQCFASGLHLDRIVAVGGSAGTLAGLLLGLVGARFAVPVTAISVLHDEKTLRTDILALFAEAAKLLGVEVALLDDALRCYDDYLGPGYAQPTPEMVEAVRLLARTEGILLDPTYTGKAMAGLIDLARRGVLAPGENVLFLHTGGAPGLYAHPEFFQGQPSAR